MIVTPVAFTQPDTHLLTNAVIANCEYKPTLPTGTPIEQYLAVLREFNSASDTRHFSIVYFIMFDTIEQLQRFTELSGLCVSSRGLCAVVSGSVQYWYLASLAICTGREEAELTHIFSIVVGNLTALKCGKPWQKHTRTIENNQFIIR